jgi:transposase
MKNLKRPSQTELDAMSHAEKDALILKLFDWLEELEERINRLENKIVKDSNNSSKPPSSDGLRKGAAQPRKLGEKSNGGQKGHQGITRRMIETPDLIETLYPTGLCACGADLTEQVATVKERRQQIEIPEPKTITTEYRQMQVLCRCGLKHYGKFPVNVTPNVSYGARLKAYSVGLVQGHFVALERTSEIIHDQYGIHPSGGTIQKWILQAADYLATDYAANQQAIGNAKVANFDESGMRINGKLHWLHVATAGKYVHYSVHEKRGHLAMDAAGILPDFTGIAVHDHWKPYWHYSDCRHALCNAHHLRELRYCEQLTGGNWAIELRHLLVEGKKTVAATQAEGGTALTTEKVTDLLSRYDQQIAIGLTEFPIRPHESGKKGRAEQHTATNLLIRLRDFKTEVWRFLTDWHVPFDNNQAERMVRPVKVKLKVTGGFRAVGGSEAFCIIRSMWETTKLNDANPFDRLRVVFIG